MEEDQITSKSVPWNSIASNFQPQEDYKRVLKILRSDSNFVKTRQELKFPRGGFQYPSEFIQAVLNQLLQTPKNSTLVDQILKVHGLPENLKDG